MHQFYKKRKPAFLINWKPLAFCALICLFSIQATAVTYNVTVTTDGNATNQLRGAILAAEAAGAGPHTINVAAGTYTITLGQIIFGDHAQNITIVGAGPSLTIVTMTATPASRDRIFFVNPSGVAAGVQTTIQGIKFMGGHLRTDNFGGGAILCGGPTNTMTITNCIFDSNTIDAAAGTTGGAINHAGGGSLVIDQCSFTNNTNPVADGGAVYYFLQNNPGLTGSLTVTNCTFSNNSVTTSGTNGGALGFAAQGAVAGQTFSVSIQKNTFLNNHANSGNGGAIVATNSFSAANVSNINYNRFAGNTALNASTTALAMNGTQGSVSAINNWWGCNLGPVSGAGCDKAGVTAGTGTLTTTPWLQLKTTASVSPICPQAPGNASLITASFLSNSASATIALSDLTALIGLPISFTATLGNLSGAQATIQSNGTATVTFTSNGTPGSGSAYAIVDNIPAADPNATASLTINASAAISGQPPASSTACTGNPVTFTVTATGTAPVTYQWYKGATALTNGATGTGSTIAGVTAATMNIFNAGTSDNAANYNVIVTNSCRSVTSNNASLTVSAPVLASSTTSGTSSISSTNTAVNDASCNSIANLLPSGAAPLSGNVTTTVTITPTVPTAPNGRPYVQRHYDIVPAVNAANATATVTLYFSQAEFNAFNAVANHGLDLPKDPADVPNDKANVRVFQYHGTGTAPGNYSGAALEINPADNNIVWNSTFSRWEITFTVVGFSGFYLSNTGTLTILPLQLVSFSGGLQGNNAILQWVTTSEVGTDYFELQSSADGIHYNMVTKLAAEGNNNGNNSYQHTDISSKKAHYYRLKIVDKDGKVSYSNVVIIYRKNIYIVQVTPNPFRDQLQVNIEAMEQANTTFILTDMRGNLLSRQQTLLRKGSNNITMKHLNGLAAGTYLLHIVNDKMKETLKVVKAN